MILISCLFHTNVTYLLLHTVRQPVLSISSPHLSAHNMSPALFLFHSHQTRRFLHRDWETCSSDSRYPYSLRFNSLRLSPPGVPPLRARCTVSQLLQWRSCPESQAPPAIFSAASAILFPSVSHSIQAFCSRRQPSAISVSFKLAYPSITVDGYRLCSG